MRLENYRLLLPDAEIFYIPKFISKPLDNNLFETFLKNIDWRHEDIKIFGRNIPQPRLTALYGDAGKTYGYSNIRMEPNIWTSELRDLKNKIEIISNSHFTTVLLNLYRDGADSNGWHADNEKELGKNPTIASLSLGGEREFQMKHNDSGEKLKITLESGSLLLMSGETQHNWKHQIPKTKKFVEKRINLTFRKIVD